MPTIKEKACSIIAKHKFLIVQGETGSGKTTKIPPILRDILGQPEDSPVVITVPRKIAAKELSSYINHTRGVNYAGYHVGGDNQSSYQNQLLFVTPGILLRIITADPTEILNYSCIVIDEVHDRSVHIDILLGLLKLLIQDPPSSVTQKLQNDGKIMPTVVLMSATLDLDVLLRYFGFVPQHSCITSEDIENYVLTISAQAAVNKKFTVSQLYLNDMQDENEITAKFEIGKPEFQEILIHIVLKEIQRLQNLSEWNHGTILVFLPGVTEITLFITAFNNDPILSHMPFIITPLHSRLTTDEQDTILRKTTDSLRKVIVATNIAESSITINDVTIVFNFCLSKVLQVDVTTGHEELQLVWSSTFQNTQRKGRAGRVNNSLCYNVVTRNFDAIPKKETPEIQRINLEQTYLLLTQAENQLCSPSFPSVQHFLSHMLLDAPTTNQITSAVDGLLNNGALIYNPATDKLDITWAGKCFLQFPVSHRYSKFIILSQTVGLLQDAIYITSAFNASNTPLFTSSVSQSIRAWECKINFGLKNQSDEIAVLNCYRTWQNLVQQPSNSLPSNHSNELCFTNSSIFPKIVTMEVDLYKRARHVFTSISSGRDISKMSKIDQQLVKMKDTLILQLCLAGSVPPSHLFLSNTTSNSESSIDFERYNTWDLHNCIFYEAADCDTNEENLRQLYEAFDPLSCKDYTLHLDRKSRVLCVQFSSKCPAPESNPSVLLAMQRGKLREKEKTFNIPKIPHSTTFHLTYLTTPTSFYVIPATKLSTFYKMRVQLQSLWDGKELLVMDRNDVFLGAFCVTFDNDARGAYGMPHVRGIIQTSQNKEPVLAHTELISVFCIDTGVTKSFPLHTLKQLQNKNKFHILMTSPPPLAVQCWIPSIQPCTTFGYNWTRAAIIRCSKILKDYNSFDNHFLLQNAFINKDGLLVCQDVYSSFFTTTKLSLVTQLLQDKLASLDSTFQHYFPTTTIDDVRPDSQLKGPICSTSLTFHPTTFKSHQQKTRVAKASVNSIVLDKDHSIPKVLIAAEVKQTKAGLLLDNTTLLPPCQGMFEVIQLMFAPLVQVVWYNTVPVLLHTYSKSHDKIVYPIWTHKITIILDSKDMQVVEECRNLFNMLFEKGSLESAEQEHLHSILTNFLSKDRHLMDMSFVELGLQKYMEPGNCSCNNFPYLEPVINVYI